MKKHTAGRENVGELAPKFAELNDDVLWGQILICVDGEGWYQEEGKEARRLKPGDVVTIPANEKHWHGATAKSWFSHWSARRKYFKWMVRKSIRWGI